MEKILKIEQLKRYSQLVEKQTGRVVRPYRADGYVNMLTKYGTSRDSSEAYKFEQEPSVPDDVLMMYYEGNGLFAKIIDTPAEEALKNGFVLEGLKDQKLEDFYLSALDDLDWEETAMTAVKWARLFGGSLAVMLINDGRGLEEPLDWRHIRSIDDIRIYDRSLIQPDYQSMFNYNTDDPFGTRGSRLGMPEYYNIYSRYGNFRVHDSRCLIFQNGLLPENTSNSVYQLWGMPEYVRLQRAIRDSEVAHGTAVKLLDRSVQAIYKMKDLSSELATEEGENRVLRRLQTIDMARGLLNSITIDGDGEEYEFRTFNFNGASELIDTTCNYLSALTCIPQTLLFGRSPAGMNSTGAADLENWYNYLERIQKRMIRKNLRYLISIIFQAGVNTGKIDEVPQIDVKFNPLWSLSEQEEAALEQTKAATEQTKAATAQLYVNMQVLDPTEVRQKLAESDEFDIETMLDDVDEEDLFPEGVGPHAPDPNKAQGGEGGMPGMAPVAEAQEPPKPQAEEKKEEPKQEEATEEEIELAQAIELENEADNSVSDEELELAQAIEIENDPDNADGDEITDGELELAMAIDVQENMYRTDNRSNGSVGVYVVKDGKVLTGTRGYGDGQYLICGPGGHIEDGETSAQAAIRETQEEFGITPLELIPIGKGDKEANGHQPDLYLCVRYEGEPKCDNDEMNHPVFREIYDLENANNLFEPFGNGLKTLEEKIGIQRKDSADEFDIDWFYDKIIEEGEKRDTNTDGGPGSGNFGHAGRPGEVGGSASDGNIGNVISGKMGNLKPKSAAAKKIDTSDALKEVLEKGKHNSLEDHMDKDGNLSPERQAVHDEIIKKFFADKVPYDGRATMIMAGGGPASGKSFISRTANEEFGKDSVVKIDPDDMKAMLPGYRDMAIETDEAAGFYHEESSALAKRAYQYACDNNINVVYDGTGDGSEASVAKKMKTARDAGYEVVGRYVTVDIPEAFVRNEQRYLSAKEKWDNASDAEREKMLPPRLPAKYIVNNTHVEVSSIVPKVANQFDRFELYDNNGPFGSEPIKIATCTKGDDIKVTTGRESEWQKFLDKAKVPKMEK